MQPRVLTAELMDDPGLDPALHAQALAGLGRLNRLSHAARPVCREVRALLRGVSMEPAKATVVDIATGAGDLLIGLARDGIGTAPEGRLIGVDISATALEIARARAADAKLPAHWLAADVLNRPLPMQDQSVDLCVSSLFLHHLEGPSVARLLSEMARVARIGIVISDLRRSRLGLALAVVAGRVMTRSHIVHVDSVKSVRAAWTQEELQDLAVQGGLRNARVRLIWPQRLLLTWSRA